MIGRDIAGLEVGATLVDIDLHGRELEFRQPLHRLRQWQIGKTLGADTHKHVATLLSHGSRR